MRKNIDYGPHLNVSEFQHFAKTTHVMKTLILKYSLGLNLYSVYIDLDKFFIYRVEFSFDAYLIFMFFSLVLSLVPSNPSSGLHTKPSQKRKNQRILTCAQAYLATSVSLESQEIRVETRDVHSKRCFRSET